MNLKQNNLKKSPHLKSHEMIIIKLLLLHQIISKTDEQTDVYKRSRVRTKSQHIHLFLETKI